MMFKAIQSYPINISQGVRSEDQFNLNVPGLPTPADPCYRSPEDLSQLKDLKEDIQ